MVPLQEGAEVAEVNKEDFLLAMEVIQHCSVLVYQAGSLTLPTHLTLNTQIIFRLYDQDGNSVVTKREVSGRSSCPPWWPRSTS